MVKCILLIIILLIILSLHSYTSCKTNFMIFSSFFPDSDSVLVLVIFLFVLNKANINVIFIFQNVPLFTKIYFSFKYKIQSSQPSNQTKILVWICWNKCLASFFSYMWKFYFSMLLHFFFNENRQK